MRKGKRELFRIGFKQGLLRKLLKKYFGFRIWHFRRKQVRAFLRDVKHFPEELCDFLLESRPRNLEQAKKDINSWLYFESKMTNFPRLIYEEGKGKNIFNLINTQRTHYYILNNL